MIEHVIYTPDADDDVVVSYHWYESREPDSAKNSYDASRRVS